MKVFSIIEPISRKLLKVAARDLFDLAISDIEKYRHPQEDFLDVSNRYPIFSVADGVTLLINKEKKYPNPSGAGDVAKIFCDESIKTAERLYKNFSEENIKSVFDSANGKIREYNNKKGRVARTINFGTFDYFHTTAALALLKDKNIFWGTICDAGIVLFDATGDKKFQSPACLIDAEQEKIPDWKKMNVREKNIAAHKFSRNKLDSKGKRIGYGVLTGEKEALAYVNSGTLQGESGDILFVFSDGFEEYFKLSEFIEIFQKWPKNINRVLKKFTQKKSEENPSDFGHERSLIAVKF